MVAQACSTAAGNFLDQVLCRCSRLLYKRQQRTSAECLRMSRRTSCICFQYVTILVICKPARPDLPKNKIAVFADRGRPDHFFRYFVAFAWSRLTKVNVKSSAFLLLLLPLQVLLLLSSYLPPCVFFYVFSVCVCVTFVQCQ